MIDKLKKELKCYGYLVTPYTEPIKELRSKQAITQEDNNSIKIYVRDEEYDSVYSYLLARGTNPQKETFEKIKYIRVTF